MTLKLITQPVSEPVTVEAAKDYLRIDFDDDDALIERLLSSCRESLEDYLGVSYLQQTWELRSESLDRTIMLPRGPIKSVTSISAVNDETAATVSSAYYTVDLDYAQVRLKEAYMWPTADFYLVRYITGYAGIASIPEGLIQGLLDLTAYRYEQRDSKDIPTSVKVLVDHYRVFSV